MREHTTLVVGHSPSVEPPVTFDGLKRITIPRGGVPDRLDVVVCVEEDGRCTGRCWPATDHRRLPTAALDGHLRQSGAPEQFGYGLGRPVDMAVVEALEGDARDTDQILEVGAYAGQLGDDGVAYL